MRWPGLLLLASTFLAFSSAPVQAASAPKPHGALPGIGDWLDLSPYWDWKTIETDHFRVTFPLELQDPANRIARYLEEAHTVLSPLLRWEPSFRTQILVIDNADTANGLTTPVGRFGIVFYATPPDNWFSTAHYDDWLRMLAIHEYTHFLSMDPTRDFWKVLRYVFGDAFLPNSLWPSWMAEGLAVYMETRFTRAGRGRSTYYEMILRAAVEEGVLDSDHFVTLDRINGRNPYFPGGETPYLFGYGLMNRVARTPIGPRTSDNRQNVGSGEEALGILSQRSSGRVPYLINGNLENITGKDWYENWAGWIEETRRIASEQLKQIRSQAVTPHEKLTSDGYSTLGLRISPDGRWFAFTQDSVDRRMGLFVKDLQTGQVRRPMDKLLGASLSFTPDSRFLLLSALRKTRQYYLFSDLAAYSIAEDSWHWISDGLRARDPDVSKDGKWIVFTQSDKGATCLAIAELQEVEKKLAIGPVQKLWSGDPYDRVSTPRFSPDGKMIYFTVHRNGRKGEDLMRFDREAGKATTLLADEAMNRYPTFSPNGELYFVSDLTGVDNLWRYRTDGKHELRTNLLTGLAFPEFTPTPRNDNPDPDLYAAIFGTTGWNIAKIGSFKIVDPAAATIPRWPAPPADERSLSGREPDPKPVAEDYSAFPSILPRQWAPFVILRPESTYFGGQIAGFDAVDRHRYVFLAAYDTLIERGDLMAHYTNRSLGPALGLSYSIETTDLEMSNDTVIDYRRRTRFGLSATYPILWTYSSLTPSFALSAERSNLVIPGANPSEDDVVGKNSYVPTVDSGLEFSNLETSRLAITPEAGRQVFLGSRLYLDSGQASWKQLFVDREHFRVFGHSVLVPAISASWVSNYSETYAPANVVVQGRFDRVVESLPSTSFSELALRGYPYHPIYARAAAVTSLDYRFPITRIFRGWGTNPAYLDDLFGFVFAETGYFPNQEPGFSLLPSAGGGARLASEIFLQIPLILSLEYHHGFRAAAGGRGEVFFQLLLGNFEF